MGKRRLETIDNLPYCNIIYNICDKEVYALELAKKLNKDHSPLIRQLVILKKEGFIEEVKKKKKEKNKTYYKLNWIKINQEFLKIVRYKKNKNIEQINQIYKKELLRVSKEVDSLISQLENNSYLIFLFKMFFNELKDSNKNFTLKEIFESIINFGYGTNPIGESHKNLVKNIESKLRLVIFKECKSKLDDFVLSKFNLLIFENNKQEYLKKYKEYIWSKDLKKLKPDDRGFEIISLYNKQKDGDKELKDIIYLTRLLDFCKFDFALDYILEGLLMNELNDEIVSKLVSNLSKPKR